MATLSRIRERKLFQWAIAYLAGAWLVLQVVGLLAQPFGWPAVVLRVATVVLAVGLLAALVVAWYHGEQGRQMASGMELLMLGGILLIAGVGVSLVGGNVIASRLSGAGPGAAGVAGATLSPEAAEQGSIAVLPFVNLSSDAEQEYFSDGLTEELLNVLAQVPELRVAARTSAFSFKGKNVPIDSIGRALRVGHVLEGSVRKAGDQVRITAQLIDARTGYHVWSRTYDRGLSDVFAVQEEISLAILEQLRLELAPGSLARRETISAEAHNLVLQGTAAARRGGREGFATAERAFQRALELDPEYARAHAGLGRVRYLGAYLGLVPQDDGYAEARRHAERALELDPNSSEGHALLGQLADTRDWDFEEAERRFALALASNPSDANARSFRAWFLMRLGRVDESIREATRATELDPLSASAHNALGSMYAYAGRHEAAAVAYRTALALSPDATSILANLALTYGDLGRHEQATATAARAMAVDSTASFAIATSGYIAGVTGRRAEADRALARLRTMPNVSRYLLATVHAGLGERDRVFELLDQAVDRRDDFVLDLGVDPVFEPYRDDPRFSALLRRMGL